MTTWHQLSKPSHPALHQLVLMEAQHLIAIVHRCPDTIIYWALFSYIYLTNLVTTKVSIFGTCTTTDPLKATAFGTSSSSSSVLIDEVKTFLYPFFVFSCKTAKKGGDGARRQKQKGQR